MMLPSRLQIYFRPRVTLNFDLLTSKMSRPRPVDWRGVTCIKIGSLVFQMSLDEQTEVLRTLCLHGRGIILISTTLYCCSNDDDVIGE